jgi:hypothetical protein
MTERATAHRRILRHLGKIIRYQDGGTPQQMSSLGRAVVRQTDDNVQKEKYRHEVTWVIESNKTCECGFAMNRSHRVG